jgi:hypothetical protein
MKRIAWGLCVALVAVSMAHASCKSEATGNALAGAALTSFMTKCERDATTLCGNSSAELKLAGAVRTSHTKQRIDDSVGG